MSSSSDQAAHPSSRHARRSKQSRAGLVFPVTRVHQKLRSTDYVPRVSISASLYMASALEYLTSDIIESAGWVTIDREKKTIAPRDLLKAIQDDDTLRALLTTREGALIAGAGWVQPPPILPPPAIDTIPQNDSSLSAAQLFARNASR
ncbi:hypothetical protein [Absidia glauca]|uniref:Histone H2A n=1 Tax=Absidia glauca TaxID=4829 RepID=A0A168NTT9_ABSGL|nr:hypothetical protein [Absidia glauca]